MAETILVIRPIKSPTQKLRRCAAVVLALCLSSIFANSQDPPVVDRIVAVVDEHVITLSDVLSARQLSQFRKASTPALPDSDQDAVIQALVEEYLIRREIESFPGLDVAEEEVQQQVKGLDSRYADRGGLAAVAGSQGLSLKEIDADVRYQLRVKAFLAIRFFSFVNIESAEIERYYRETLPGLLKKEGIAQLPPLEEVRQKIHALLAELRVQEDLNRWIEELKRKAEITYFPLGMRFVSREQDKIFLLNPDALQQKGQKDRPGDPP